MAASTGSMAVTPYIAAVRSATSAPPRPLSVPTPAIWPKFFRAVRGSNRSVAINQNPDPSIGPSPETCR